MERKNKKAKETLSKLLAASAGTLLVASATAPAPADAALRSEPASVAQRASVSQRAGDVRDKLAAPAADVEGDAAPVQLAWWGNWHNGGWHPYWHNWPNWRNWHNWGNW